MGSFFSHRKHIATTLPPRHANPFVFIVFVCEDQQRPREKLASFSRSPYVSQLDMAAATSLRLLVVTVGLVIGLPASSSATRPGKRYRVGGPDGWRVPPPEDKEMYYANWASPITFYVEDSIEFVYKNDSVIKVDKVGYYHCNETAGPAGAGAAPRDGRTLFLLDAPGYAYFASADLDHCKMGQRLMINVLVSDQPPAPSPSPFPSPFDQAPGPSSSWMLSPPSAPAPAPSTVDDAAAAGHSLAAASSAHAIIMLVPITLALALAGLI